MTAPPALADEEGHRHGTHVADVGRLAVINPTEAVDLLATLAESHTGQLSAPTTTADAAAIFRQAAASQPPRPVSAVDDGESEALEATDAPAHPEPKLTALGLGLS